MINRSLSISTQTAVAKLPRISRRGFSAGAMGALAGACVTDGGGGASDGARLDALFAKSDEASLALNPMNAVARGDLRFADQFGDLVSDAFFDAVERNARSDLSDLRAIRRNRLTPEQQVAHDVFEYQTEITLASFGAGVQRIIQHLPIDPYTGYHLSFPQWSSGSDVAPFHTLADYESGVERMRGYARYLDAARDQMRAGIAAGHVLSDHATRSLAGQLSDILGQGPDESPFLAPLSAFPEVVPASDRARLSAAFRQTLVADVMPATERLRDFVAGEYARASRTGPPGLVGMTDGPTLYAYWLEQHTTTTLTADQIHDMGLAEVARIRQAMEETKVTTGFAGSLAEFFVFLRTDARFKPTSAEALLQGYRDINTRVTPLLGRLFGALPHGSFEIRAVPPEQESSAGGAYYVLGSPDGTRPGVFFVNTSNLEARTAPPMTSLFLHEAIPGHHLQGTLAQENTSLPAFLRFGWNTGFGEGWALYAESLGQQFGLYSDPYQYFGHLDLEIFRALRLVVDTGLHAKGWSRQQSIDYMLENSSQHRTYIEQEVDRYISWPGQATAYKVGELVIRDLRRDAEQRLGARFDVRAFHDRVLRMGCIPLRILQTAINSWAG